MEQTNMVLTAFQAMAARNLVPQVGKDSGKATDDFQKLLDQKSAQPAKDSAPADNAPVDGAKNEAAANQKENAPAEEEDPLEQVKKLAEQGYVIFQPTVAMITDDGQTFQPGEYVIAWKGSSVEFIPTAGLDENQMKELEALVTGFGEALDVSDPEADALLEATDPNAKHDPAQLLEKLADKKTGDVAGQVVEEAQGQEKNDEQVEVVDVEQAPQKLFHDVQAAPVKVGEVYDAHTVEEPDVAGQIDAQLAQALQNGDTVVRVQLTPENLGRVTVELVQNTDGALHVLLSAQNADTRGLLERHASELQGLLAGRTEQTVEISVQQQSEAQQNQNQQHGYDGHNGNAQQEQHRQQRREHTRPEDFMQQLRLGLIPDGEEF